MDIDQVLERVGLDEKERRIYLTLLKAGLSKANRVAEESRIERRTAYEVLGRMKAKNIVFSVVKSGVRHFQAIDPKKILEELKETKKRYEEILPKLEQLSHLPKEELKTDILVGREGLKTVFNDILRTRKEVLNFGAFTKYDRVDYILWAQFLREVSRLRIPEKAIHADDEKLLTTPSGKYRKVAKVYTVPTSALIYGNKVVITVFGSESYSLIRVENKDFADSYRKYFNSYWKNAKKE